MEHALRLPEIVSTICQHVYSDSREQTIDPPLLSGCSPSIAIRTLHALCMVNRLFYVQALPLLYRHVSIPMPMTFEALVGTVGVLEDDEEGESRRSRETAASAPPSAVAMLNVKEHFEGLFTPPSSRESSRGRDPNPVSSDHSHHTPGPRSDSTSSQLVVTQFAKPYREENHGMYTKSFNFERFRSHGLSRTGREGSRQRFVTPQRLLQVLRGTRGKGKLSDDLSNGTSRQGAHQSESVPDKLHSGQEVGIAASGCLQEVGLTEYIDSALTIEVLEELLLRGGSGVVSEQGSNFTKSLRGSDLALSTSPIEAIDFCGCVSRTFVESLQDLVQKYNLDGHDRDSPITCFPHLHRLGLFNVLVPFSLLTPLVTSFPNLTHLDLANTRTTPELLEILSQSSSIRLQSLSMSKCLSLTSQSLHNFFLESKNNVLADLVDLNLYFDATSPIPLTQEHLKSILERSVTFRQGKLRYLDISTAPLNDELLDESFHVQTNLLDLGISNCPHISWTALRDFLGNKAQFVEVLDMRGSCRQPLFSAATAFRTARRNDTLLNTIMGVHQYVLPQRDTSSRAYTGSRVRVLELDEKVLEALDNSAAAHPDWKVFYGTRYRGWYVNCAIAIESRAPVTAAREEVAPSTRSMRKLDRDDPNRMNMVDWARKSKRLGQHFGWHSRKMCIIRPDGMREWIIGRWRAC